MDSIAYSEHLLAVTYAYQTDNETVAFFSVLNDSIREDDTTKGQFKKISKPIPWRKRHKSHPAVKIGRFAVSVKWQRKNIGSQLMDFIKGYFTDRNKTGCRFITVDAYNNPPTIKFYQNNGFEFLTVDDKAEDTRLMYFDLITFKPEGK